MSPEHLTALRSGPARPQPLDPIDYAGAVGVVCAREAIDLGTLQLPLDDEDFASWVERIALPSDDDWTAFNTVFRTYFRREPDGEESEAFEDEFLAEAWDSWAPSAEPETK